MALALRRPAVRLTISSGFMRADASKQKPLLEEADIEMQ